MLFGVVRSDRAAYSLRVCLFYRDKAGGKGASGFSPLVCRTPAYSGAVDNGIVGSGVCWDFYRRAIARCTIRDSHERVGRFVSSPRQAISQPVATV
jgi:hypothetical protein